MIKYDRCSNKFYEDDSDEEAVERKRVAKLLRYLEKKDRERYRLEHRYGYCSKCHCLIPMSGKCDCS